MKLLLCEWSAFMQRDVEVALHNMKIDFDCFSYCFGDVNEDEFFCEHLAKKINAGSYFAVFSMNYFPVIAKVCNQLQLPYISWVYDCPFDVPFAEKTLGLCTNHIFFFDRAQSMGYQKKGFQTVDYMPLAVNAKRLDRLTISMEEKQRYESAVSFVGKLYQSDYETLCAKIDSYDVGYLEGLIEAQGKVYGYYFLEEAMNLAFSENIHRQLSEPIYQQTEPQEFFRYLVYTTACQITRRERLTILSAISERHPVKIYSHENSELLPKTIYCGTASSFEEMPKVFRSSKINFNITFKQLTSGIPLRVLDILGAGGFLLSNYQPELAEYFEPGVDFAMYQSQEEAVELCNYYLTHEEERKKIAQNGRNSVNKFSFENQLKKILKKV